MRPNVLVLKQGHNFMGTHIMLGAPQRQDPHDCDSSGEPHLGLRLRVSRSIVSGWGLVLHLVLLEDGGQVRSERDSPQNPEPQTQNPKP